MAEREKKEADLVVKGKEETITTPTSAGEDDVQAAPETDKPADIPSEPTEQPENAANNKGHWFDKFSKAPKSGAVPDPSSEGEDYRVSNLDAMPRGPARFDDIVAPGSSRATLLAGAGNLTASGIDALSNA